MLLAVDHISCSDWMFFSVNFRKKYSFEIYLGLDYQITFLPRGKSHDVLEKVKRQEHVLHYYYVGKAHHQRFNLHIKWDLICTINPVRNVYQFYLGHKMLLYLPHPLIQLVFFVLLTNKIVKKLLYFTDISDLYLSLYSSV